MIEIFSYWIFVWFLLFYFKLTSYNPFIILLIAYIFTLFELIYLFYYKINRYNLIKFFIINVIIKFIPILLIFKYPIEIRKKDLLFGLYLFLIYLFVMSFLNKNPYIFYKKMLNTYIYNDSQYKSQLSILYDKIINYSYNIETK
jgi:hypothetical protein